MRGHTSSPQPQAVERKNKHLNQETESNLGRGENKKDPKVEKKEKPKSKK